MVLLKFQMESEYNDYFYCIELKVGVLLKLGCRLEWQRDTVIKCWTEVSIAVKVKRIETIAYEKIMSIRDTDWFSVNGFKSGRHRGAGISTVSSQQEGCGLKAQACIFSFVCMTSDIFPRYSGFLSQSNFFYLAIWCLNITLVSCKVTKQQQFPLHNWRCALSFLIMLIHFHKHFTANK